MWPFKPVVKSTHRVEVVPVVLEKHPNADTLSTVRIAGYQLVVRTVEWEGVTKGAYIQPDSMVNPEDPTFAFLGRAIKDSTGIVIGNEPLRRQDCRITAKKFRGQRSEGLLVAAPRGSRIGDNVAGKLGITRYVSPQDLAEAQAAELQKSWWKRINNKGRMGLSFAGNERGPSIWIPVYDLENWYRYPTMFKEDDNVVVTEKIHGCNSRFVYSSADKRMYAGSHRTWKKPYTDLRPTSLLGRIAVKLHLSKPFRVEAQDDWNLCLRQNPAIETFCRANPDHVLFGEIYGDVQDLTYGCQKGERKFIAFDVFEKGAWWTFQRVSAFCTQFKIPQVPVLYIGAYNEVELRKHIDGKTVTGSDRNQMREGCVIRLWNTEVTNEERGMPGRKTLKAVSSAYLERSSKDEEPPINDRIREGDKSVHRYE